MSKLKFPLTKPSLDEADIALMEAAVQQKDIAHGVTPDGLQRP